MLYHLFKFFIVISLFSVSSYASEKECLESNFNINFTSNSYLFGLIKNQLIFDKNGCEITIENKKLWGSKWIVDVCREPIHVKKANLDKSLSAYKRVANCPNGKDDFCEEVGSIEQVVLDQGLMYAKGGKEDLNSDHGKIYCARVLMGQYFGGNIFNKNGAEGGIYPTYVPKNTEIDSTAKAIEAPELIEKVEKKSEKKAAAPIEKEQVSSPSELNLKNKAEITL